MTLLYATWHTESIWTLKETKFDFDYQIVIELDLGAPPLVVRWD